MADIGTVGAYLPLSMSVATPLDRQRDAARRLEDAGYAAAWSNEVVGGKDVLIQLGLLLASTERITFGTGIANIWARAPQTTHAAAAQLAEAYPGRLVLGLGVGYPAQAEAVSGEFGKPLATMRDYLRRMGDQTWPPAPDAEHPRIVGALGPKMLALGAEVADGVMTADRPPEFTAQARTVLGPDKLLVVALPVAPDADHGAVADGVRAHVSAGADHVVLMPPMDADPAATLDQFIDLAGPLGLG